MRRLDSFDKFENVSELDIKIQNSLNDFFQNHASLEQGEAIALAVSGGPDSMALAQAVVSVYTAPIHIITVDHGLRTEAKTEAQGVKQWVGQQAHDALTCLLYTSDAADE